jgi:Na+/melibiose symporter-like transporter
MGAGLSLIGYNGKAPVQSDRTLLLMRLLYVLPVVFNIFVIWVIARFPLTAQVMANVRRTIDARSAQPAAAGSGFIPYSADPNGGTPGTEQ